MIYGLRPYAEMKECASDWFGEVPSHWMVRRLKTVVAIRNGATPSTNNEAYWNGNILWVTPEDLGGLNQRRITSSRRRISYEGHASCGTSLVPPYSVAVSTRAPIGHLGILESEGCANQGCKLLVPKETVLSDFLYLQLESARAELQSLGQGTTFPELSQLKLGGFRVLVPPVTEQTAIVNFLDQADRRIRRYILAKEKLIALLQRQKEALTHQTVTGQFDVRTGLPYPAYKPSGVKWLGEVPAHWEIARLKTALSRPAQNGLFKKKDQFGHGVALINVADVYGERFQIDPSSLQRVQASPDELHRFHVESGDIFFVRSSLKLEGTGRSAIAISCGADTVFECHLVQIRPNRNRVNPQYLVTQLNSYSTRHHLISRANVVTMATIAQNTISSCPVVIPPRLEQDRIVHWLDRQWNNISNAIDGAIQEVRILREYRSRLIADVVTGKLDVREAAATLPESDDIHGDADEGLQGAFEHSFGESVTAPVQSEA